MSQAQLLPTDHFSPSVTLHHGRPATTSREVASFFGKRHDDVLKSIRNLRANCPEEFHARNFAEMSETVKIGNGAFRQDVVFILHRDGFMLLVMGYTGKKALAIKLAYIEAFNRLEAELAAQRGAALPNGPHIAITPSTTASRKPLEKLVKVWAARGGIIVAQCWTMLNAAFNLQSITELPEEWIPDALEWVQGKIDSLTPALPVSAPLRAPLLSLSPDDLAALDRAAQRVEELNRHVMKEIGELHVEILGRVDLRRVQFPAWEVMSEFIFYSLFRAVELPSGSLEREKNPALALKMLAGALGNR